MIAFDFDSQVAALLGTVRIVDWSEQEAQAVDAADLSGDAAKLREQAQRLGCSDEMEDWLRWLARGKGPEPEVPYNRFVPLMEAIGEFTKRARGWIVVDYDFPLRDLAPCHLEILRYVEREMLQDGLWPLIDSEEQARKLAALLPEEWRPEYEEEAVELGSEAALRSAVRSLSIRRWRRLVRGGQSGVFEHRCGDLFFSIDKQPVAR